MSQERIGPVVQEEYQASLRSRQARVSNEPGKARLLVTAGMGTREFLGLPPKLLIWGKAV